MRIEDRFTVSLPVADAWTVLLDLERIAPCLPGAELQEVEGDDYRGVVKVKLGAITAQFRGVARFAERDEAARRVVLQAEGRELRGQGNASATVTATLREADGGGTEVAIDTDLSITGRMAQFGRGVIADVSSKLLGDFARCLEDDLAGSFQSATPTPDLPGPAQPVTPTPAGDSPPAVPTADSPPAAGTADSQPAVGTADSQPAAGTVDSQPVVRRVDSRPAEPLDLLAVAGGSVAQRALPAAVLAVLALMTVVRKPATRRLLALVGAAAVAAQAANDRRG